MSTFYPDNDKREKRLRELTADTHDLLSDARKSYATFLKVNDTVNQVITAVYQHAGISQPPLKSIDILTIGKISDNVDETKTHVEIADLVINIGSGLGMEELAPAATMYLVDAGALTAETAETVLDTVLGAEITVGTLVGGLVGAIVAGAVAEGMSLAISAIEGSKISIELKGGIAQMKKMREKAALSKYKCEDVILVLQAIHDSCKVILEIDPPQLTKRAITSMIDNDAKPSLKKLSTVNRTFVLTKLYHLDIGRNSWLHDG